jgi:D-alanyl-D-alanine carboxypeptidase/D-alanyl-D-alanine-endopeptidase (penicillin-binding protein 4)
MTLRIKHIILLLFFLTQGKAFAQPANSPDGYIKRFINSEALKTSHVGIQVTSVRTGEIKAAYQGNKMFVPASTIKVLYTMAAIDQLGSDYRFETRISYSGEILEDGSLEGDLIIQASGDPSLGANRFSSSSDLNHLLSGIYKLLGKKGISCIDGQVVVSNIGLSNPVSGDWLWEDVGNYYASGAWDFNFNENQYEVEFEVPKQNGQPTKLISISPRIPFLILDNQVVSGPHGSGDQAYIFGGPNNHRKIIRGTLPAGVGSYRIKGAIPNPPYNFGVILQNYLEAKGIFTTGVKTVKTVEHMTKSLGVHRSPALIELVRACNNHSINLYSEAFGKALLAKNNIIAGNQYPDSDHWSAIFKNYKIPDSDLLLTDACGLARTNLISPNAMNGFLINMVDRLGADLVLDILPQNGVEGSATDFIKDKKYSQRLWIKSGYVSGVLNYTGFFRDVQNDELYAFTIFTNNNKVRTAKVKEEIRKLLKHFIDHSQ